jgi:hypothetical protein
MYVERNTEGRSRNRFRGGKTISITYSECVLVALVIQHAMGMCRIILFFIYRSYMFRRGARWRSG